MSERKLLTLEELRNMVDKPVYIKDKLYEQNTGWIIWDESLNKEWTTGEDVKSYGKDWFAYSTEPTFIDRSAWEPCEFCKIELNKYPYIMACDKYSESNTAYEPEFCPGCGRPLTEEAWLMLEKRLEN